MAGNNENSINISTSRAYLRELAIQKWKTENTDELTAKLAEKLIEKYPVITLGEANLLSFSQDDREAADNPDATMTPSGAKLGPQKKGRGPASRIPDQWAVVDLNGDVIGGFGNPDLNDEEGAIEIAKKTYPKADQIFLKHVLIKWNATHVQFRKTGDIYSLDGSEKIPKSEMDELVAKTLDRKIKAILEEDDPITSGRLPRSVYSNINNLSSEVDRIRKTRIDSRREWIEDQYILRDNGEVIEKKTTHNAPGGSNPATVDLQTQVDYELISVLLRLFHKAPIAAVLCKSQLWMHEKSDEPRERASLTEDGRIGVGEGEQLRPIIESMVKLNFSVQPIFNIHGATLGTLELKALTTFITQNGWDSLPEKIDIDELKKLKILGRKLPVISHETTVETVAVYLRAEMNTDGVLFEWTEEANSAILPDNCRGILEDGFHIVTSHDLIAYQMSGSSN